MKFKDALQYSLKTLSSPAFLKRIEEEDATMLEHLDILKEINKYGFLTTNSQAGSHIKGISKLNGKKYDTSERAYLIGFMEKNRAEQFLKEMSLATDKTAIFVPYCSNTVTIPAELDIPLTITKKEGKVTTDTHISVVLPESVWNSYRKEAKINKNEPIVFLLCWDSKWNRNASSKKGLFTDVLSVLKQI